MRSKRYVIFMFDDQASRWTQVATKPSQDRLKMAQAWPKMAPSLTQVAHKIAIWLHKRSVRALFVFKTKSAGCVFSMFDEQSYSNITQKPWVS